MQNLELRWHEIVLGGRVEWRYVLGYFDHIGPRFSLAEGVVVPKEGQNLEEAKRESLLYLKGLLEQGIQKVDAQLA